MVGKANLAVPHLEAVAKFDRNNGSGHGVLGRIAWINGQSESALEHWKRAANCSTWNDYQSSRFDKAKLDFFINDFALFAENITFSIQKRP